MDDVEKRLKEEREGYYRRPDNISEEEHRREMEAADRLIAQNIEIDAPLFTGFGPMYQNGSIYMENPDLIKRIDMTDCDFGVQVASDGRVWVCINGLAWIRFKPSRR